MKPNDDYIANEISREISKMTISASTQIPYHVVENASIDVIRVAVSQTLLINLRTAVYTEELVNKTISYPTTWIDAFKKRWFPQWLINRYPARYTRHHIHLNALYPDYVPIDKHNPVMKLIEYSLQ